MTSLLKKLGLPVLAAVLSTTAFAGGKGVQFIDLGTWQDNGYSFAGSMSSTGKVIAGMTSPFGGCARWTAKEGWVLMDPDNETSGPCLVSRNGKRFATSVVDTLGFQHAAVWNGNGWDLLVGQAGNAPCDFLVHGTFDISGDGNTIGGLTWEGCSVARGFTWTDEDGMIRRDGILDDSTRINALNKDGSIAVGWNRLPWGGWQATKWVNGVPHWIRDPGPAFDNFLGEAMWTNAKGTVITGRGYNGPPTPDNPFAVPTGWVQYDGGEAISTGALPGAFFTDQGIAFAASEDGSIVVGRFGFGPFSSATMWTRATGLINLNQFLVDQGLTQPFDGWFLVQVSDISDDGTKLLVFAAEPGGIFGNTTVLIDISKVAVCHGNKKEKTLMVSMRSIEAHLAHGDFFGVCN